MGIFGQNRFWFQWIQYSLHLVVKKNTRFSESPVYVVFPGLVGWCGSADGAGPGAASMLTAALTLTNASILQALMKKPIENQALEVQVGWKDSEGAKETFLG